MSVGSFAKDAGKAVVKGAANGGGLIGAPFKAAQTAGNVINGVQKSLHRFDKAQVKKSRFRQKQKV